MAQAERDPVGEDREFDRLVQVAGVFLTPLAVLAASLGIEGATDQLKGGISGLGFIIAIVWSMASLSRARRIPESFLSFSIGWALPLLVTIGWIVAANAHTFPLIRAFVARLL